MGTAARSFGPLNYQEGKGFAARESVGESRGDVFSGTRRTGFFVFVVLFLFKMMDPNYLPTMAVAAVNVSRKVNQIKTMKETLKMISELREEFCETKGKKALQRLYESATEKLGWTEAPVNKVDLCEKLRKTEDAILSGSNMEEAIGMGVQTLMSAQQTYHSYCLVQKYLEFPVEMAVKLEGVQTEMKHLEVKGNFWCTFVFFPSIFLTLTLRSVWRKTSCLLNANGSWKKPALWCSGRWTSVTFS
jgi:hypothetical protein